MNSEWKEVKLGEVANVLSGYAFKSKDFCDNGVPVIKIKNIIPPYVTLDDVQYVSQELAEEKSRYELKYKDILISLTGSNVNQFASAVGKVGRVKMNKPMMLNQRVGKFEILDESVYNLDFLYYLVSTEEMHYKLAINASGAANQSNISPAMIKNLVLPCPPINEQKAIADTLCCLDDKIELNNRINKTLEEMAQAIFKSWFVDFEPFQDGKFEDSELGSIPKGWSIKALYDFADYINGTSFKKDEYSTSGYPIVKITELKNGITSATQYFSGTKDEKYYIKTGDILFSWSGNPQTSIDTFIWVGGDAILNQHTFKVSIKNSDYCYIYLLLKFFKPEFTRLASSKQTTGLGHVTISDLKRLKFPYNYEVISEFCTLLNPVIQMYIKNSLENEKLSCIRDTLLPKLMSGEIRVLI